MRGWIFGLLAWFCAFPAWAEWSFVEAWVDPLTDLELHAATSTSDTNVKVHLFRYPSGRVYVLFTAPEDGPKFATSGIVGRITPEGFETRDIEVRDEPGRFVEYGRSSGHYLRARLWHGQGETPTAGALLGIIKAGSVSGTFQLADGSTLNAQWGLEGAGLPIAQALGIQIEGVAAGAEWEDTASRSLMAAMNACQFPKLDVVCVQKVTMCSGKISEDRDIGAFEACVSGKPNSD